MSEFETQEPNLDPLVGKTLSGRFVLDALISRGGMGKVYRATQKPLDRIVALKVLDVVDSSGEFRRRFFMEASLSAKLTHPHTVRIYDYGATDDGIFFIAMEHLQGRTLHDMLHHESPVDPLRALVIMRRICGALAEAHDAGIVHRDLKPANVFLVRHGDDPEFPKVIDFGLVKELGKESDLSRTGHVLGSPMYMAPEQVEARAVDARTDVYAAGLILYYMLAGRTAFKRGNPMAVLMAQVQRIAPTFHEVDPKLQVPAVVEWVVRRCIEKRMEDRFANMHELLRGLKVAEKVVRGELPGPVDLELEDGRLVVPEGLDISEDLRLSRPARSSMVPAAAAPSDQPHDTTLLPGAPAPESTSTSVGLLVAGSAVSALVSIGAVLAILLVLAGGWWAWSSSNSPQPTTAIVEPAGPGKVTVTVTSQPPGAEVERDGGFLGTTPLALTLAADDPGFNITVRADGYQPRDVRVGTETETVHAPLVAVAPGTPSPRPSRPSPRPAPSGGADAPAPAPAPSPAPAPGTDLRDPWEK